MSTRSIPAVAFGCLVVLCTSHNALGQAFNIDIAGAGPGGPPPSASYGAAAGQPGFWNASGATLLSLLDVNGVPTGAQLAAGGSATTLAVNGASLDDERLMRSAHLMQNTGQFAAVLDLLPGKYDIYCYGWGGSLFGNRTVTFRVFAASGQVNKSLSYTSVWPGQQIEGVTYVRVPIEVSPLNTGFSIELGGGPGVDPVNVLAGIQIVPVPAPGFAMALGAGAIFAARRRR